MHTQWTCKKCKARNLDVLSTCMLCQTPNPNPPVVHPPASVVGNASQRYPSQAPQPQPQDLVYGSTLTMPQACTCCMAPPTTTLTTQRVRRHGNRLAYFEFPYCGPCKSHVRFSGVPGTGAVQAIAFFTVLGGAFGGLALGNGSREDMGTYAVVFALGGYLVAMLLAFLLGLAFARPHAGCSARGRAMKLSEATGAFRLRFTNPQFDQVFRGMNQGRPEFDLKGFLRRQRGG